MGFFRQCNDSCFALRVKALAVCAALAREAPLLPAALLLLAGAGLGRGLAPDLPAPALLAAGFAALLLIGLRASAEKFSQVVPFWGVRAAVGLTLLLVGLRAGTPAASPQLPLSDDPIRFFCMLRGPVNHNPGAWWVNAQCRASRNPAAPPVPLVLRGFGLPPVWNPGAEIEVDGVIRSAPPLRNFGVTAREQAPALLIKTLRLTRIVQPGRKPLLAPLREWFIALITSLPLAPDLQAAAQGMLLGGRSDLPAPLKGLHQRLTTYHLFIISGLNLWLALLLAGGVCRLLLLSPRLSDALLLLTLVLYFSLIDGEVAIRRALCFAVLFLVARLTGRERPALNAWALALILEILFSPASILSFGFQLSYLATLGLILHLRADDPPPESDRVRRWLIYALLTPWRVAAWLLPVQSALGPLSLLGAIANGWVFFFGELLLASLWLALMAAACGVSPVARGFTHAANFLWGLMNGGLAWLDQPDWRLATFAWPLLLALSYWLGLAVCQRLGKWRGFCAIAAAGLLFTALRPAPIPPPPRPMKAQLDAGQRAGILLPSGGGAILFDAGRPTAGSAVVAALRARGIVRLRGCVATHQDSDHRGGMVAVLNALHCEILYLPAGARRDPGMAPLLEIARARRIPVIALAAGDTFPFDSGRLRVLWPARGPLGKTNNRALVLLWENPDFHALLTADIEAKAEQALAPTLPGAALLKIAHHGSKTSSTEPFLAAARPRLGLISLGADNSYGHPHPFALARLAAAEIPLIRTDQQGGIRVSRVGDFFKVEGADGKARYFSVQQHPSIISLLPPPFPPP